VAQQATAKTVLSITGLSGNLGKLTEVKLTLEEAIKAQRRSRGIALLFLNLGARWGWVVNTSVHKQRCSAFTCGVHRAIKFLDLQEDLLSIGISTLSLPSVKEHFHKTGMPEVSKFILLLDICNAHSREFEL